MPAEPKSAANAAFSPARFRRDWRLFSGHLETIAALAEKDEITYENSVVNTPDQDEVLMCWIPGLPKKPVIVIFHGLEGCAQSHTVRAIAAYFAAQKWTVAAPHFRSCGHMNLLPRAYHAADSADIKWMIDFFASAFGRRDIYAAGVSLGGNALIKCLDGEQTPVRAAAAISAPLNLPAAAKRLSGGLSHLLYGRHFVKLLRKKIIQKSVRYPALCGKEKLRQIRTIGDFDRLYTAPAHGFAGAEEYWRAGSAEDALLRMKMPLLCINAQNDPFIPAKMLPQKASKNVVFCRPKHGGHGSFIGAPSNWLGETLHQFFTAGQNE